MKNSEINFVAAFGNVDKQVKLSYVSGVVHPIYQISINNKRVGTVGYYKLTLGGRPEVWRCEWDDKYKDIFTSDDTLAIIEIASTHYSEHGYY